MDNLRTKLLMTSIIIVMVAGVTTPALSQNMAFLPSLPEAYAAGTLQSVMSSPSNNQLSRGFQLVFAFNTQSTTPIHAVRVTLPANTATASANSMTFLQGLPSCSSVSGTNTLAITCTLSQDTQATGRVVGILSKMNAQPTQGQPLFTYETLDVNLAVIDSGSAQATFALTDPNKMSPIQSVNILDGTITSADLSTALYSEITGASGPTLTVDNVNFRVGIGNHVTPDETLTVGGNIKVSGNIISNVPTLKIIPQANGDICIGSGC